jgi:predicted DNA-binding transcriptional regulator YafY
MRVDRLLSIILIILNRKQVTGLELAEHFEVSVRTIYRDIDKLCEAGVPIAAAGGVGGGYYLMDNYKLDKSFFNKNEIKPLMAVVDNLNFLFGRNDKFNSLSLKFGSILQESDKDLVINMSHFSMEKELKETLIIINKAIEKSELLEFDYINRRMDYESRIV